MTVHGINSTSESWACQKYGFFRSHQISLLCTSNISQTLVFCFPPICHIHSPCPRHSTIPVLLLTKFFFKLTYSSKECLILDTTFRKGHGNAGYDGAYPVAQLQEAHSEGNTTAGPDTKEGTIGDMAMLHRTESFQVKRQAL